MPKYWVKNYFAHGRFSEVGQNQKTEKKERERLIVGIQWPATHCKRTSGGTSKAAWAKTGINLTLIKVQSKCEGWLINEIGPGGLRAPCIAWPLLLPSFSLFYIFSLLRLLLLTHFGESPVCENLFPPIFWHN